MAFRNIGNRAKLEQLMTVTRSLKEAATGQVPGTRSSTLSHFILPTTWQNTGVSFHFPNTEANTLKSFVKSDETNHQE